MYELKEIVYFSYNSYIYRRSRGRVDQNPIEQDAKSDRLSVNLIYEDFQFLRVKFAVQLVHVQ